MKLNSHIGNVDIKIDTKRIDKNLKEAQKVLNLAVRTDCEPLVPHLNGQLRRSANFPEGVYGGVLEYNTPYAHYQYQSEIYSPNIPIKDSEGNITGWFSPPGKKKNPTGREMKHHTPGTTGHWFEVAKERNLQSWVRLVKETAGKD